MEIINKFITDITAEGVLVNAHRQHVHYIPYRSGISMQLSTFLNNKLHGAYTRWYANGNINVQSNYANDVLHGSRTVYHSDGRIWYSCMIANGKMTDHELPKVNTNIIPAQWRC